MDTETRTKLIFLIIVAGILTVGASIVYSIAKRPIGAVVRDAIATECPMDAQRCPDGSYVGRVAPSCEFARCE